MNIPEQPAEKPVRTPFFSDIEKKIFKWYGFTAVMVVGIIASIIGATLSFGYSNEQTPLGGLTLLWRIPLGLGWAGCGFWLWYKLAEFWDPADVKWVDDLFAKLRRR